MRHDVRVQAYGHYGVPNPVAFVYNVTGDYIFRSLQEQGLCPNLMRLRDKIRDNNFNMDRKDLRDGGELTTASPICLDYQLVFDSTMSDIGQWIDTLNSNQYMSQLSNPFKNSVQGIGHKNSDTSNVSQYVSNFKLGNNEGWSFRGWIYKPPTVALDGKIRSSIFTIRFGVWQFQIRDGKPEIAILKPTNWTQTNEDLVNAALQVQNPTSYQIDVLNDLRSNIYQSWKVLTLGHNHDNFYGQPWTVTFIPEPRGIMNIILEGVGGASVEYKAILSTHEVGTMYDNCPITVRANGLSYFWQVGYPNFFTKGLIQYPFNSNWYGQSLTGVTPNTISDTSMGSGCTSISLACNNINGFKDQMVFTLATTNPRYTPFLYAGQAVISGGPRPNKTLVWDSNNHLDGNGKSPVISMDAEESSDKSHASRSRTLNIVLRNPGGSLELPGQLYEGLENLMVDISINGTLYLTNGIVLKSAHTDMLSYKSNQAEVDAMWGPTETRITIGDMFSIFDEDIMQESLIGDGQYLSDYITQIIANGGEYSENISTIPSATGMKLPFSVLGSSPLIYPSPGTTRGQWLRDLMSKYGQGYQLYVDSNGYWQFILIPTTVSTIEGHTANFVDNPTPPISDSYPDRFIILGLKKQDFNKDYDDIYNVFEIQGATLSNGFRLKQTVVINESVNPSGTDAGPSGGLGRIKRYPVVNDSAIATHSQAQLVLRQLVSIYARTGRYYDFETFFHRELHKGMILNLDGNILARVEAISGVDIGQDLMNIVLEEISIIS